MSQKVQDPVCGMTIDRDQAAATATRDGKTNHFCSTGCAPEIPGEPGQVRGRHAAILRTSAINRRRTSLQLARCTREFRQDHPGTCPKCGMKSGSSLRDAPAATKVEYSCPMHPQIVARPAGQLPNLWHGAEPARPSLWRKVRTRNWVEMSRRFWVGLALSLPIFLLAMGDMLPGKPLHHLLSMTAMNWVQLALATPVVFWCGRPFFERAWSSVIHRSPNMFTLIALGVGVELNIVQRPKDAVGWVLLPIRWTVERTFAWLGRCRRLSKDREKSVRSSEAFVKLAMIHLMLNRLRQRNGCRVPLS